MRDIPDGYYELAIVDPPYGIGEDGAKNHSRGKPVTINGSKSKAVCKSQKYTPKNWDKSPAQKEYFDELFRVSKNQIIWGGNYFDLPPTRGIVCWDKQQPWENFSAFELAWTSFDSSARMFRYAKGNESGFAPMLYDKNGVNIHPTQKPIALYKWLLTNYAKPNDKILDTHGGSGSIAIACYDMGFDLDICELDTEYYEAARKRYDNHIAQRNLFKKQL
jgi:site-specific DNA-methyltransferase (adenine-specific)